MKEANLVENYISLRKKTDSISIIVKEKGYRQKKIDVIEINPNQNIFFHGIEFKISDWRLGLKQCLGNRILIPYNSLALYYKYEENISIDEFSESGIGLIIIYDDNYDIKLLPKKNTLLNYQKSSHIFENIRKLFPRYISKQNDSYFLN